MHVIQCTKKRPHESFIGIFHGIPRYRWCRCGWNPQKPATPRFFDTSVWPLLTIGCWQGKWNSSSWQIGILKACSQLGQPHWQESALGPQNGCSPVTAVKVSMTDISILAHENKRNGLIKVAPLHPSLWDSLHIPGTNQPVTLDHVFFPICQYLGWLATKCIVGRLHLPLGFQCTCSTNPSAGKLLFFLLLPSETGGDNLQWVGQGQR